MSTVSQSAASQLEILNQSITRCSLCARLAIYRAQVARIKKPKYQNQEYWGKPVPGWGDQKARLLVLGLAPGAHGANRTGQVFSGDGSGQFLRTSLQRAGLILENTSDPKAWPQHVSGIYFTNAVRCVPPGNHPTVDELRQCAPYLLTEYRLLTHLKVILALGTVAYRAGLNMLQSAGQPLPHPRPNFAHGSVLALGSIFLVASYHPSRYNTQTGRLTAEMLDSVLLTCRRLVNET
jgi:uracil-DNA glycosylase family 4